MDAVLRIAPLADPTRVQMDAVGGGLSTVVENNSVSGSGIQFNAPIANRDVIYGNVIYENGESLGIRVLKYKDISCLV
jgi:hypothetical protein